MAETPNLALPLLAEAQAQKHLTVNEALERLDALAQLTLRSRSQTAPPAAPEEGDAYAVPADAGGAWAGCAGELALWSNGGWLYVAPRTGWRAWIVDEALRAEYRGQGWQGAAVSSTPNGAGLTFRSVEILHEVAAGATSLVQGAIPARAILFGVSGRVVEPIGGAASWRLGNDAASDSRFGSGLGVAAGAWLLGELGTPTTYYAGGDLLLTAEGGDFTGGRVRLAVHYAQLAAPAA
ncbi:MAG: DUF2793 domain-containing protein [Tranquillimonas sp.]